MGPSYFLCLCVRVSLCVNREGVCLLVSVSMCNCACVCDREFAYTYVCICEYVQCASVRVCVTESLHSMHCAH